MVIYDGSGETTSLCVDQDMLKNTLQPILRNSDVGELDALSNEDALNVDLLREMIQHARFDPSSRKLYFPKNEAAMTVTHDGSYSNEHEKTPATVSYEDSKFLERPLNVEDSRS